jgi:methionyl-tRNA formyltransferase
MKIGFFGDGPWSHLALEKLLFDSSLKVMFICARFENPDESLEKTARKIKIPFLVHSDVNSEPFIDGITQFDCDLFVSMSFNQIFGKKIRTVPKVGIINCHAGKLPFYRGRNILNWALINDEKEFGITVHFVDDGIDTGDIILQRVFPIVDEDSYQTLLNRSYLGCSEILYEAVQKIQSGSFETIRQNSIDPIGSYFSRRLPGDEVIDWNQDSRGIFNFVRALTLPGPLALTRYGNNFVRVSHAVPVYGMRPYKDIPGSIIGKPNGSIRVKTKDTAVDILTTTPFNEFRIGYRLT